MSEVIAIIILLAEILTVLQCLQISFMQELRFDKYMFVVIIVDVILYMTLNAKILPPICSVLFYLLVFIYCYYKFKQGIIKSIVCFIIGLSLTGCIEVITACMTSLISYIMSSELRLLLSSILALLIVKVINKKIPVLLCVNKINTKWLFILVIIYGVALSILLVDYYLNNSVIKIYAVLILASLVFIFIYFYRLEQAHYEIEIKNRELELQDVYGSLYEDLLNEVRRKQHDYKNQLGTMYSMYMVTESKEELLELQSKYINDLQENPKYELILTGCNNQILAGYLYYKCIMCEQTKIIVDYHIIVDQAKCYIPLHEIIEMLGILIDNAIECVMEKSEGNRKVRMDLEESDDMIKFSILNPARFHTYSDIERMFEEGYSSKGENRGLGLTRINKLVKKYQSEIVVENIQYENSNWLKFEIRINKRKTAE